MVATTCDNDGSNVGLWAQLNITPEDSSFPHPVTGDPIFHFPDVPHLLKLLRNWLLDAGFILYDGQVVSREPLEELITSVENKEINAAFKLRRKHTECKKAQRQNVELAAQLFSHTAGTALLR